MKTLNTQAVTEPPRAAATVVLLRDAGAGLEVFLLRRHERSAVLGGAHVFAGGKVDEADAGAGLLARLDQPPQALHESLHEPLIDPPAAAGLYVAALRELFEECGVLLAQGATPGQTAQALALAREGHSFGELLARLELRLQTQHVRPWSRWITPLVPSLHQRRFDTRFFVAELPAGQVAVHDNHEATQSLWIAPRQALRLYWDGAMALAPPQIMTLAALSRHATVADALARARSVAPPVIQPETFEHEGCRVMCYPGDERHSLAVRAMPGPTRLVFRNQRFEPFGGFDALFA